MKLIAKTSFILCLLFVADLCFSYVRHAWHAQTALQDRPVPSALDPIVKQNADTLKAAASNKGISIVITEGFRSFKEQDELYKQGRTKKGILSPTQKEGNRIIIMVWRLISLFRKRMAASYGIWITTAIKTGNQIGWRSSPSLKNSDLSGAGIGNGSRITLTCR